MPTNETIIPFSRAKLIKLLLLFAGCLLLVFFFVLVQLPTPALLLSLPALLLMAGAFIFFTGFLLGTLYFRQIIRNGPGLIIDNTGFTDYTSILAAGYIPWSEVKAIKPITLSGKKCIAVILKNPDAFLERQPNALKRKAMTHHLRNYGSPVRLDGDSLECSFDELLHHLQSSFDRSRPFLLN
jgi:hypothetical protein